MIMNVPSKNGNSLAVPCLFLAPSVFGNGFSGLQIIVDGVESSALDLPASSVKNVAVGQNPYLAEFGRSGKGRLEVMMCKTARRGCKISCRSRNFLPILPVPTNLPEYSFIVPNLCYDPDNCSLGHRGHLAPDQHRSAR